jgi:predicted porin
MNKKLGLAVAGAVLAFGASTSAMAGITIPAGDWTVDIGGNVNAFYTNKSTDVSARDSEGNAVTVPSGLYGNGVDGNTIGTGLLPAAFGIGAKTRQNDLDIAFQFSFFTGTSSGNNAAGGSNTLNIRQAFLTFGDASWGTIKAGRDLGIFGSDAILSDMTLLGVGVSGAGSQSAGGSSTLGRIGSGYIYADWKGQMSYTSPNWNGFQVAAGVMEGFNNGKQDMGYEAKATYDFAANDVTGRVWLGGLTQKSEGGIAGSYTSRGVEVGAKAAYQGFGLVGYYYDGRGLDGQFNIADSYFIGTGGLFNGTGLKTKDSGGYVQATFVVPGIGTKLGASYGESNSKADLDGAIASIKNESYIVGAYHPLTKSLNLVAEYTKQEIKGSAEFLGSGKIESDTVSLGAIMFF